MFPVSKTKWGGKKSEMTREMRNGDGHHTNCSHAGGLLIPHMVKCWQKKAFREGREGKGERERENLDFFFHVPSGRGRVPGVPTISTHTNVFTSLIFCSLLTFDPILSLTIQLSISQYNCLL